MNDRQRVRRPGSDGDGDDERPRRKKNTVKMHPVVGILVLFVLPLVFVAIFVWAWMMRGGTEPAREDAQEMVIDDNDKFKEIKQEKMKRAYEYYRVARKNKMDPDFPPEQLTIDQQKAKDYIAMVKQELDALLDPLRDDEGILPKEYSAYQTELKQLNQWLLDILKESGF